MKLYLAGPDVFRKYPLKHFEELKKICEKYGHEVIIPLDFDLTTSPDIFQGNITKIKYCDCVVANMNPFRGICIDDGTAWEIGNAFALGKMIWGYSDWSECSLKERTNLNKFLIDDIYPGIEDFGLSYNLMLSESIKKSGGKILKTFEEVLKEL